MNVLQKINISMDTLFFILNFYSYSLLPVCSKYKRWRNDKGKEDPAFKFLQKLSWCPYMKQLQKEF